MLLHFVNPLDNTIMEVQDVIRTLDYRTEELDPFFKEFNVLKTEGASASALKSSRTSTEMVLVLWLAGVTAFLTVTLVVVLCVCISQRQRYIRKLKAATTMAYGSREGEGGAEGGGGKEVVPNTNRHATEGSNPIWMTGAGYDNLGGEMEEEQGEEEEEVVMRQASYEQFDSLDANVLNDSYEEKQGEQERLEALQEEEERLGYSDIPGEVGSLLPASCLSAPCSLFSAPCSLLPAPCSLLPAPCRPAPFRPAPCSLLSILSVRKG